jgi:hypothetical protein
LTLELAWAGTQWEALHNARNGALAIAHSASGAALKSDSPPQLAGTFARLAHCATSERQDDKSPTSRFTN